LSCLDCLGGLPPCVMLSRNLPVVNSEKKESSVICGVTGAFSIFRWRCSTRKIKAASNYKMSAIFYQTTCHHILEDSNFHCHCHKNHKFCNFSITFTLVYGAQTFTKNILHYQTHIQRGTPYKINPTKSTANSNNDTLNITETENIYNEIIQLEN